MQWAIIAQRSHETRLSGLLAGAEGTTQWVTRHLAQFSSCSTISTAKVQYLGRLAVARLPG